MSERTLVIVIVLALSTVALASPVSVRAENLFPNHPDTGVPEGEIIVAVLDTGADGTHKEFGGYRGQAGVTDPQIVAWYDFGVNGVPAPGVTWDPATPVPYDSGHGGNHGTGTASLVGGATVGAYPGVKLAIAKVTNDDGGIVHVEAAIEWAVKTVGADVLSMSFGLIAPVPGSLHAFDEAVEEAFRAGVLPVTSAGNGVNNFGVRYPSELGAPAGSPYALVVGASGGSASLFDRTVNGYYSNTDPDVTAHGTGVRMADPGDEYGSSSGTSFSCPLVAGWAAQVMQEAMDHGQAVDPARIEQLIAWTANDNLAVPYLIEGFGYVSDGRNGGIDSVASALAHARAGTTPGAPNVDNVVAHGTAQAARTLSSETSEPPIVLTPTGGSTAGTLGASVPQVRDVDAYAIPLALAESLSVRVTWNEPLGVAVPDVIDAGVDDIDVYLYRPGAGTLGVYQDDDVVAASASSTHVGANDEAFTEVAGETGTFILLVEGWLVDHDGVTYTLDVEVGGTPVTPTFLGDHVGVAEL